MADEDDKPWPLVAVSTITDETLSRADSRGSDMESEVDAHIQMAWFTARKLLREAGRMRDVRQIRLIINKEKE